MITKERIVKSFKKIDPVTHIIIACEVAGALAATMGAAKGLTKAINRNNRLISDAGFGHEMADLMGSAVLNGKSKTTMGHGNDMYEFTIKAKKLS